MAANCRVYDSRQQQADCQEPGSAPELYPRQQSIGYLYLYFILRSNFLTRHYRVHGTPLVSGHVLVVSDELSK